MNEEKSKELAEAHWEWLEPVLFECYRTGYIHNPCGEMDWNEDAIKESFDVIKPLLKRLYIDAIEHGIKHGQEEDDYNDNNYDNNSSRFESRNAKGEMKE